MICGHDMGAGFVCGQGEGHLENGVPHLTMNEGAQFHTEMRRLRAVRTAAEHLCGALSVWRPVQPPPDPTDCSSGYPEWIRKAWTEVVDALEPIYAEENHV